MFKSVIGNENTKESLKSSIEKNQISHSYLFLGEEGIGKQKIAKEFSKNAMCERDIKSLDCTCKSCVEFKTNNNSDYMKIVPDGNSIKIGQIRELQRKILEKPVVSNRKIYLINDADKMTTEAQNCLLKTLEEPPEFVVIILIVSNINKIINTVKSRCMIMKFSKINNLEIQRYMKNVLNQDVSLEFIELSNGSVGKTINLKENESMYLDIQNSLVNLDKIVLTEFLKKTSVIYGQKEHIFDILDYIELILLRKAKENYKYINCIGVVENTKLDLNRNVNFDMAIDNMLFTIHENFNN